MRFSINREDTGKWLKNALIFAIPALIVLVASFKEIIPDGAVWAPIALYVINVATDLLRKYLADNK